MSALHPKYEKALDDIFEAATWKQQGAHVQSVLVPVETFEHANAGLGLMRLELLHLAALRTRLEDAELIVRAQRGTYGLRLTYWETIKAWSFDFGGRRTLTLPDDGTGRPILNDAAREALKRGGA